MATSTRSASAATHASSSVAADTTTRVTRTVAYDEEEADHALAFLFTQYAKPRTLGGSLLYVVFLRLAEDTALLDRLTPREAASTLEQVHPPEGERISLEQFKMIAQLVAMLSDRRSSPADAKRALAARMLKAYIGKYPHKLPPGLSIPRLTDYRPTTVTPDAGALAASATVALGERSRAATPARVATASICDAEAAPSRTASHATEDLKSAEEVGGQGHAVPRAVPRPSLQPSGPCALVELEESAYRPRGLAVVAARCRRYVTAHDAAGPSGGARVCALLGVSSLIAPLFEHEVIDTDDGFWLSVRRSGRHIVPEAGCQIVAEELAYQRFYDALLKSDVGSDGDDDDGSDSLDLAVRPPSGA
jgi:hypothetical protein